MAETELLDPRADVEITLRRWAKQHYHATADDFIELANKLSVPAEFRRPSPKTGEVSEPPEWQCIDCGGKSYARISEVERLLNDNRRQARPQGVLMNKDDVEARVEALGKTLRQISRVLAPYASNTVGLGAYEACFKAHRSIRKALSAKPALSSQGEHQ